MTVTLPPDPPERPARPLEIPDLDAWQPSPEPSFVRRACDPQYRPRLVEGPYTRPLLTRRERWLVGLAVALMAALWLGWAMHWIPTMEAMALRAAPETLYEVVTTP